MRRQACAASSTTGSGADGQRLDRVHLAADAGVVHGHDRLGARRDRLLHQSLVDVQRVRADVHELRRRAAQHEGVRRRDEGERGQDHFVAGPDVAQDRAHLQRRGARRREQDARRPKPALDELLALPCERAVAASCAAGEAARDQLRLVAHQEGLIEGDLIVTRKPMQGD